MDPNIFALRDEKTAPTTVQVNDNKDASPAQPDKKCAFSVKNSQWPRFGHDNHNTFSNVKEKHLNPCNVGNLTTKWQFNNAQLNLDSFLVSQLVVDGLIYIMSFNNGHLYVLDAATGTLNATFNGGTFLTVGSGASCLSSPVIYKQYIYIALFDLKIYSYNRFTGAVNTNWTPPTIPVSPPTQAAQGQVLTSLTIVPDRRHPLLFVAVTDGAENHAPSLMNGTIDAYDLHGNLVWSQVVGAPEVLSASNTTFGLGSWSTPSFDTKRKLMFIGTEEACSLPDNKQSCALQCRDYRTGKLIWNYQYVENSLGGFSLPYGSGNPVYLVDRDVGASPILFCGKVDGVHKSLVGAQGKDGTWRAFDRCTGRLIWLRFLTRTPVVVGAPCSAYHKNVIYTVVSSDIDPIGQTPTAADEFSTPPGNLTTPAFSAIVNNAYPVPLQSDASVKAFMDYGDSLALNKTIQGYQTNSSIVTALDAGTGNTLWRQTFGPSATFAAGTIQQSGNTVTATFPAVTPPLAPFAFTPNMVGGYLYYRIGGFPGSVTLPVKITSYISATMLTVSGPANTIPAGTKYTIYFGTGIPSQIDDARGPGLNLGQPCFANGVLYLTSFNGYLLALDGKKGTFLYAKIISPPNNGASLIPFANQMTYVPTVVDGVLYVSFDDLFGSNAGLIALTT